jgi:hypothetical protein
MQEVSRSVAIVALLGVCAFVRAAPLLTIDDALRGCNSDQCAGVIEIRGWLNVKFEHAALYSSPDAAAHNEFENCLGVRLPHAMREHLEKFNRYQVTLRGVLNGLSEGTCGSAYLVAVSSSNARHVEGTAKLWPSIDLERNRANPADENSAAARALAIELVEAFTAGNLNPIRGRFAPKVWAAIDKEMHDSRSRYRFLLANSHLLLGNAYSNPKTQVDVYEPIEDSSRATVCVCKRSVCDPARGAAETGYQSFADPYFCFLALLEEGRWYINDTLFTYTIP